MAMADFNKISVNSSLTVVPANFASLCFNDGLVISKSKYTIVNNILNLLVDTTDTVSIFSNNGIATTYEFEYVRLNIPGTILPSRDINDKPLAGLSQNKILVFVNGRLQPSSAYTVVNENTLKFNINYTNEYNELFNITIYSSTVAFQRITYTKAQLQQQYDLSDENGKEELRQNRITLPITYEAKNTAIFLNEVKIGFNAIDTLDSKNTTLQLNIPQSIVTDTESLEVIKFTDNNITSSINFTTRQGYLEYGPYDDLGKKLPNTYNVIFKFTDQVKLLIDNMRTGFMLKEVDGYGEAVIVDTNFESMEMKGLVIQPFPYSSYPSTGYYLEVPEYTTITDYLAEFDKKYTFLPEILVIFQRLLLDEINDTIERLRATRSISKVDSVHINKLIKFLGFDINIKQLNKKQRRELIEELNEFYRIAGTRNSYNLINILQNNLKLINAEQLFTPSGFTKSKQTLYNYSISVDENHKGSGYQVKDALKLENSGLVAIVDDVDENGAIQQLSLETAEGYKQINESFTMQSILNGTFKATSTPNLYSYDWTLTDPVHLAVNTVLQNSTKTYGIKVTALDGDNITFEKYAKTHNPDEDKFKVDFNKLQLYRLVDDFTATINCIPTYNDAQRIDITNSREEDLVNNIITYTIPENLFDPKYTVHSVIVNGKTISESQYTIDSINHKLIFTINWEQVVETWEFFPSAADTVIFVAKLFEYDIATDDDGNEYNYTTGGQEFTILLKPGIYYIDASGGGGSGSSSFSIWGALGRENGQGGELRTSYLELKEATVVTGKVGQGGGEVRAVGWEASPSKKVAGNGYENGELGQQHHLTGRVHVHHGIHSHHESQNQANSIGGQGGGSTALINANGETIILARGGNGGNAVNVSGGAVKGGIGGSGGILSGSGAAGGRKAETQGWSEAGADGWLKIYKVPLTYDLTINGDISTAGNEIWETVESGLENNSGKKIEFEIVTQQESGVTTYTFTPTNGFYGCYGTFNLTSKTEDSKVKLTISSTVSLWDYYVKLNADPTHISLGSVFINQDSPLSDQFIYTITKEHSTEGTWVPMQGPNKITLNNVPAYTRQGVDAIAVIGSRVNTQKNEDRCYIDFYTKEELGAEQILEFRSNTIEYGEINQGTPKSPKPWEVGEPDIEYGTISDTAEDFINYGTVDESTEGEWVEWWKWDREKIWYPTNHVDLEMKLPPGVNFSEYVDTFIEQFYNLASTVVFIHQITESFYFGNDTNTSYNTPVSTQEDLIGDSGVMVAPFGIVSTAPTTDHELIVTSDPNRQYVDPIGDDYNVTIIPEVPNATVSVITENISSTGQVIQTVVILTEANHWTTKIKYGTKITYKVEANGYITKTAILTVTKDIIKHVVLKSLNSTEPKYCKLEIKTFPQNATVTFTVNNITTTQSHTIYAWEGNTVQYSISHENYVTKQGTIVLNDNTELEVQLEKAVLFTVRTNPVDADVIVTINNVDYKPERKTYLRAINGLEYVSEEDEDPNYLNYITEVENQLYVPINQNFSYTVSKPGYTSKTATTSIAENTTIKVKLEEND